MSRPNCNATPIGETTNSVSGAESTAGHVAVGHPIDVASGAMFGVWLDFGIRGVLPFAFHRTYNTGRLGDPSVPLGRGWRHVYQHELRRTLEGYVYVDESGVATSLLDPDGALDTKGKLVSPGHQMELRKEGNLISVQRYASGNPQLRVEFEPVNTRLYRPRAFRLTRSLAIELNYADGKLVEVRHTRSGRRLQFEYDRFGRVINVWFRHQTRQLIVTYTYNLRGDLVAAITPAGLGSRYQYNDLGLMTSEMRPSGAVYEFVYDSDGRCIRAGGSDGFEMRTLRYDREARETHVTDSHGATTSYTYNDRGQVIRQITPSGATTDYVFDEDGRITKTLAPIGKKSEIGYDSMGRTASISHAHGGAYRLAYDDSSRLTAVTDPAGNRWEYFYDENGQVRETLGPTGIVWTLKHNEWGELESAIDPLGKTARRLYDLEGNLVETTTPTYATTRFESDEFGREIWRQNPDGSQEKRFYDASGNMAAIQNTVGQTWSYRHDNGGRVTERHAPNGAIHIARYNSCGQVLESVSPDGTVVKFTWDTEPGRLLKVEDPNGRVLEYVYDSEANVVERRNFDGSVSRFEYDLARNQTAAIDPTGQRYEYEYDAWNNMTLRRLPNGEETKYTYDGNDFVTCIESKTNKLEYERGIYGEILVERQDDFEFKRTYNPMGRPLELVLDDGSKIEYQWSESGELSGVRAGAGQVTFERDPFGRELSRWMGSKLQLQHRYDPVGRLTDQWLLAANVPLPLQRQYQYDENGQLNYLHDHMRGSTRLIHDVLGRLRGAILPRGETHLYDFDPNGNKTVEVRVRSEAVPEPERAFLLDPSGRSVLDLDGLRSIGADVHSFRISPASVCSAATHTSFDYQNDAKGRVVSRSIKSTSAVAQYDEFKWNDLNHLVEFKNSAGESWSYRYDALGRRIEKKGPKETIRYLWDGDRIVREIRSDGKTITYVTQPWSHAPLMCIAGGAVTYAVPDHRKGVSELVDPNGNLVWSAEREPWGSPTRAEPDGAFGFPGQSHDCESGLFYNRHRYYEPKLGRFISPDPIGVLGGYNEYVYAPDPFQWIDPTGLTYVNGGPYPWRPEGEARPGGQPDLTSTDNRFVQPSAGQKPAVAKNPSDSQNGKCLAVVDGVPDSHLPADRGFQAGDTPAFVSGHGHPNATPHPDLPVRQDHNGNWCHSEMQALGFLKDNNISGATVWVDRPPCPQCAKDLQGILDAHFPGGAGRNVTVMYWDAEHGWETWDEYKARTGTSTC